MNLLVKLVYLFLVLTVGKIYVPKYFDTTITQNISMVGLLYLANVIYRYSVNYYYKKNTKIYNLALDSVYQTTLVILSIVVINYLLSNPTMLSKYGINLPKTDSYTNSALSLVPFFLIKSLLLPDV